MEGVPGRPCHYTKDICPGGKCEDCQVWKDFEARMLKKAAAKWA